MFYYLSDYLLKWSKGTEWADTLSPLRLFRYITIRSAGAALTALVLSWWLGPRVIAWLKQLKCGQEYADKAEAGGGLAARILSKRGTPTMGGILIVVVLNLTTLLWAQWNTLVQLTLLSVVVLSGLGFYDDYAKISQQSGGAPDRTSSSACKPRWHCSLGCICGLCHPRERSLQSSWCPFTSIRS
jgi:phospho-N-acetylmuramoyl-pentapeptide-transferase